MRCRRWRVTRAGNKSSHEDVTETVDKTKEEVAETVDETNAKVHFRLECGNQNLRSLDFSKMVKAVN